MKIHRLLLYWLVLCYIDDPATVCGEYHIQKDNVPSYMFRKFDNVKEDVFPRNVQIKTSLTAITGTLLYTMDRNMNQLIISLQDIIDSNIIIKFNDEEFVVPLLQLCGCDKCLYKMLNIWIRIVNVMFIQCNGGIDQKIEYSRKPQFNKNYPIPYSTNMSNVPSVNEAHMWLVNFPQYNNVVPIKDQLSGCIFNVSYNDEPIMFTNISDNIGRKCEKTCTNNICNGGQCYETYNTKPVCDCTHTFMNGRYCNRTMSPINLRSISQSFIFTMLKISWRSSVQDIFVLENKLVRIRLTRSDKVLSFEYTTGSSTTIKKIISESYIPNKEYIFIAYIPATDLRIEFYNDGSWNNSLISNAPKLDKEIYTSLTVRSCGGVADLVYKTLTKDYTWKKVIVVMYEKLENESICLPVLMNQTHNNGTILVLQSHSNKVILIVGLVVCMALVVVASYFIIKLILRRKSKGILTNGKDKALVPQDILIFNDGEDVPLLSQDHSSIDCKYGQFLYKGSFGRIYKFLDLNSGLHLSMEEVILSSQEDISEAITSLERLIGVYKSWGTHPRIVRYYGIMRFVRVMYICTEYVALGSITNLLDKHGPLEPNIVIRYTKQILEGLQFLHNNNIIHGDLRCYNVLRDNFDDIRLQNFGINKYSKTITSGKHNDEHSENTNAPYWTAPEIIRGDERNPTMDVWSLGATIIEMLTGKHPCPGLKPMKAMFAIEQTNRITYELPNPISAELQLFIDNMLEPIPTNRSSVSTLLNSEFLQNVPETIM